MAGLLTPEERAATAGARFGPGQPGLTALGLSEYRMFVLIIIWPVVVASF